MSGDPAVPYLTDAGGITPYHWTAITVHPLIRDDSQILELAREKLTDELRRSFGADPDVVLLLPLEAAVALLESTFDGVDGTVVMIAATVWKSGRDGAEPGDVRGTPTAEWTDDEWLRAMGTLKPNTPRESAEALIAYWREEA